MIRPLAILLAALGLAMPTVGALQAAEPTTPGFRPVACEGAYPHHLQGVCTDERDAIFWSFTTRLVKTDRAGKILKKIDVANHHGDLCYQDGKVFVAVNLGKFNDPQGAAASWVYVYDAGDLSLTAKHSTPEVFHGAGGIACRKGTFLVVGGLPADVSDNYVYQYDADFRFVKKHVLPSGHTHLGIQTAAYADGRWWFGCYGTPQVLLRADESLQHVERFEFDCSLGIAPIGGRQFLIGRGACSKEQGCTGWLTWAWADEQRGLFEAPAVSFQRGEGTLQIVIGDQPVAEYVSDDDQVRRPYLRSLRTLSGVQVTRTHPPVKGQDLDDHPTMHPGLWLAFGDLGGADFWRNKGRVRQLEFVESPQGGPGGGSFTVRNAHESDGTVICTEDCQISVAVRPDGYFLDWTSTFRSDRDFTFGDQEEMGLGVRMATPLAVVKGGAIVDSEGRKNERQVWGRQADWCRYGGVIKGKSVGVALMPHPQNFRRCWFHARDYGLLAANPFGRNAFTQGEKSRVTVHPGNELRLRFGVLVYEGDVPAIEPIHRQYAAE